MADQQKRTSRGFLGEAITTATSPLIDHFGSLSCRSPVTPRRPLRSPYNTGFSNGLSSSIHNEALDRRASLGPPSTPLPLTSPAFSVVQLGTYEVAPSISDKKALLNGQRFSQSTSSSLSPTEGTRFLPNGSQTPSLFLTPGSSVSSDYGDDSQKLGTFSAINIILGKTVGVGIYSVPSSVFSGVGSVGMSLLMWVLGAAISFCGLAVYLDLGTGMPRSGGEKVYLERVFKKPKFLATCMFMAYVVILGFSAPNCIVLGEYAVYAAGAEVSAWNVRAIAVTVITISCVLHARFPKLGLKTINVLGVGKMVILVVVILSGVASVAMGIGRDTPISSGVGAPSNAADPTAGGKKIAYDGLTTSQRNFSNIWANSSTQPYDYATALLKVLYCFRGYSTANQVLSEVRHPVKTLRFAAPVALILVSLSYILANIAYFTAVELDDFRESGVVVAGHFFRNVFGLFVGEKILPGFIIISAFGNIAATSFAQARVNQELGREGLLPYSTFFGANSRWRTPAAGLFLHWLVSVVVIIVPPGEIYNFLVDIGGYPVSVISVAISAGLLYLQSTPAENWSSPFKAKKVYTIIFLVSNLFLLAIPWIKPVHGKGVVLDTPFPYYAYPATSLAILASGVVYWVWWAKIKPNSCFQSTSVGAVQRAVQLGDYSSASQIAAIKADAVRRMSTEDEEQVGLLDEESLGDGEVMDSGHHLP
jgi:amino acid transporter